MALFLPLVRPYRRLLTDNSKAIATLLSILMCYQPTCALYDEFSPRTSRKLPPSSLSTRAHRCRITPAPARTAQPPTPPLSAPAKLRADHQLSPLPPTPTAALHSHQSEAELDRFLAFLKHSAVEADSPPSPVASLPELELGGFELEPLPQPQPQPRPERPERLERGLLGASGCAREVLNSPPRVVIAFETVPEDCKDDASQPSQPSAYPSPASPAVVALNPSPPASPSLSPTSPPAPKLNPVGFAPPPQRNALGLLMDELVDLDSPSVLRPLEPLVKVEEEEGVEMDWTAGEGCGVEVSENALCHLCCSRGADLVSV